MDAEVEGIMRELEERERAEVEAVVGVSEGPPFRVGDVVEVKEHYKSTGKCVVVDVLEASCKSRGKALYWVKVRNVENDREDTFGLCSDGENYLDEGSYPLKRR